MRENREFGGIIQNAVIPRASMYSQNPPGKYGAQKNSLPGTLSLGHYVNKSDRKGHIMIKKMSLIMSPASFAAFAVASGRSWEDGPQRVLAVPGCDSGYVVLHLCLLMRLLLFSV